ncbi:MAG: phospholipid carrier-dependent glycosyltransferase [Candidatus Dadabacteria bacterium]|nr:MAG: phospholipid carrier-dependent glycosyltransferase [Candidatus Dadabacteria bacterium]
MGNQSQVQRDFTLLTLVLLLITLPWLGERPFYSRGEPREALVAQAMLESGDYILPRRYDGDIATKPPLAHWLMVAASLPSGKVDEFSARLPSALLSVITVLGLYLFCIYSGTGSATALLASLVLFGSAEWYRSSITCRVDMTLSSFFVLSLFALVFADKSNSKWLRASGIIALALATLAKGPVAIVLGTAVYFLYNLSIGQRIGKTAIKTALIGLFSAVLAGVWYLLAIKRGGSEFLDIFLNENVRRFTGTMKEAVDPHTHGVLYLFGALLAGFLPWSFLLILNAPTAIRALIKKGVGGFKKAAGSLPDYQKLSLIVVAVFLVFFSIPSSKRGVYLLPAYPFLSVLIADWVVKLYRTRTKLLSGFSVLLAVIIITAYCASFLLTLADPGWFGFLKPSGLNTVYWAVGVLKGLAGTINPLWLLIILGPLLFSLLSFKYIKSKPLYQLGAVFCGYYLLLFVMHAAILPAFTRELSPRDFAEELKPYIASGKVYSYENFYALNFYLDRALHKFRPEILKELQKPLLLVIKNNDLENFKNSLPDNLKLEVISKTNHPVRKPKYYLYLVRLYP